MNKDYALGIIEGFLSSQPSIPDCVTSAIEFLKGEGRTTVSHTFNLEDMKTDGEKVADYLTKNQPVVVRKERKHHEWSPERREAAAERMRKMQADKKGYSHPVEEPKVNPVGNGHAPVEAGDTEVETSGEKKYDLDTGLEIDPKTGALKLF